MGKDKQKVKKQTKGRLRGFIGILISVLLLAGVAVCNTLTAGHKMFSFVTTGNVMDRFDEETAKTSRTETAEFFTQAAVAFWASSEQKYTSYTLDYSAMFEISNLEGKTYTNGWREVHADVDKDYTVYTVTERIGQEMTYERGTREYVFVKTGEKANTLWTRETSMDQSASDVTYLSKAKWIQIQGLPADEMVAAASLLYYATYGDYDAFNGTHEFKVKAGGNEGEGTLKPGLMPEMTFSYEMKGDAIEKGKHTWKCSYLNATKANVPQSLLDILGGKA